MSEDLLEPKSPASSTSPTSNLSDSSLEYKPLSLRYRPRRLDQLLGQDVLVRIMTNAIHHNRIHSTFLLFGPLGCGKTSSARIIAASLNCEKGPTAKACGKCKNCEEILAGRSVDVIELDAASNRGVDEIRDLRGEAKYSPVASRYKIFIIDEVHALTGIAAEAMLKILEEPPQSAKFILCTTERHKLIDTILSRCQDFKIQKLSWSLIAAHLKDVCKQEGIQAEDSALTYIAKASGGHVRNALQHLEKVILYAGSEPVTKDTVTKAIGMVEETVYFDLVDAILAKKFADGARIIQKVLLDGQSIETTLDALMDHLRTLLVIKICDNTSGLIHLGEEEKRRFLHQSQQLKADLVDAMITHLVSVHRGLFYNVSPQVLLEQFLLLSIRSHVLLNATG